MDELAEALFESFILESVLEAIQKRLGSKKGDREAFRIRNNAEGVFQLGGLSGLVTWLDVRLDQQIGFSEELTELNLIRNYIRYHFKRSENKLLKKWNQDQERRNYELLWTNLLIGRDLKNRAIDLKFNSDPRKAIIKRLKKTGVLA